MLAVLINGVRPDDPDKSIAVTDRGLYYGDGLFETMLLQAGRVPLLEQHLQRLSAGCARLSLPCPDLELLRQEIRQVCGATHAGVVKLLVTRGSGGRGYAPPVGSTATRVVLLYPPSALPSLEATAQWCEIRLGRNARLAGMKHLNRLEQVLAQAEVTAAGVDEGLLLDSEGELVSAVSSNVFLVRNGTLLTPDLRHCGVKGIMRAEVMRVANALGIAVYESALRPEDLNIADELLVTNAVRGVRSVTALGERRWNVGQIAVRLRAQLEQQLS